MSPPIRLIISIITAIDLKNKENASSLLAVFEAFPQLMPNRWAKDDQPRSRKSYKREDLLQMIQTCWDQDVPMIFGNKKLPYESFWGLTKSSDDDFKSLNSFEWDLVVAPDFKDWHVISEFSQRLADVMQPQIGCINFIWEHPQVKDLISEIGRKTEIQRYGVPPIGIRTWMGQHILSQITLERIRKSGAIIRETAWGGVELDLLEELWLSDFETLLQAKQSIMANLEPSGVFADYSDYPFSLESPAPNWIPIPLNK
jgi:hypothetical protein